MTCGVDNNFTCNFVKLKSRNPATKKKLSEEHLAKTWLFLQVEDLKKVRNECLVFMQQHESSSCCLSKRKQTW
jgi:hypothetical protein